MTTQATEKKVRPSANSASGFLNKGEMMNKFQTKVDRFVESNPGMKMAEAAKALGCSITSIERSRNRLGLSRPASMYTASEDRFIKKHGSHMTAEAIGEAIGRTARSVAQRAFILKVDMRKRGTSNVNGKLTDEDVELMRQLRDDGMRIREIAEKFDIHYSTASRTVNYLEHV